MELVESHHENEWVFHDPTLTADIEDKFSIRMRLRFLISSGRMKPGQQFKSVLW